jgi:hypothetical protein
VRIELPEQWPPFGMAAPFAFRESLLHPKPDDVEMWRDPMSLAGDKIATRFRDRQGREYVHVRTVPSIAASPRSLL